MGASNALSPISGMVMIAKRMLFIQNCWKWIFRKVWLARVGYASMRHSAYLIFWFIRADHVIQNRESNLFMMARVPLTSDVWKCQDHFNESRNSFGST